MIRVYAHHQAQFSAHAVTIEQVEQHFSQEVAEWLVAQGICKKRDAARIFSRVVAALRLRKKEETTVKWDTFLTIAKEEALSLQRQMDQNFNLTAEEFDQLLVSLQADEKDLFEQVFLTHFSSCRLFLIRQHQASPEDAYDATMDTLLEFYQRLKSGKIQYGNLRYLFTKMAGQVYFKILRKRGQIEEFQATDAAAPEEEFSEETFRMLDKAWDKLCDECRMLLKAFYYDGAQLNDLAAEVGKLPAALRKQKQRCVDKLRGLFIRYA